MTIIDFYESLAEILKSCENGDRDNSTAKSKIIDLNNRANNYNLGVAVGTDLVDKITVDSSYEDSYESSSSY